MSYSSTRLQGVTLKQCRHTRLLVVKDGIAMRIRYGSCCPALLDKTLVLCFSLWPRRTTQCTRHMAPIHLCLSFEIKGGSACYRSTPQSHGNLGGLGLGAYGVCSACAVRPTKPSLRHVGGQTQPRNETVLSNTGPLSVLNVA